ncbi:hypothetical protein K402DRAFT_190031 [Aulographum hederae CBS 113979]|uniref:Uncharacterized protein n=1 Tax=Aulographum hederae CBS 113979 TaxID=1176131 RepID=A0A6G1GPP3_9PEZI|nr:hypothetical protein K402DRAFT_190031 [Aulographum hederae CBS 113979]
MVRSAHPSDLSWEDSQERIVLEQLLVIQLTFAILETFTGISGANVSAGWWNGAQNQRVSLHFFLLLATLYCNHLKFYSENYTTKIKSFHYPCATDFSVNQPRQRYKELKRECRICVFRFIQSSNTTLPHSYSHIDSSVRPPVSTHQLYMIEGRLHVRTGSRLAGSWKRTKCSEGVDTRRHCGLITCW